MSQAVEIQTTRVDVLDTSTGKIYNHMKIADILTKFKSRVLPEDPSTFVFEDCIKIRDFLGWTVLKEIKLVTKKLSPLILQINNKKIITCTSILMPVYNKEEMETFQGNRFNRYTTKHFNEFVKEDLFAIIDYSYNKIITLKRIRKLIPYSKKTKNAFHVKDGKFYFAEIKTSTGTATFSTFHWITNFKEK